MDFDEDVEELDTRKRDLRQPTGADAAGVLALWQKSRAKRIVESLNTTAIPLDCSRCLHSFAQIRPSTKATSGTRSDAQTSGGLLIVGELPGHPVIGHTACPAAAGALTRVVSGEK